MKNSILLSLIVVGILFTFITSCQKDELDNPDGPDLGELLVKSSIDSDGGTIEAEDVTFIIPSGAFNTSCELSILKPESDYEFGNNAISGFYNLDGLPLTINKPIKVKIKYTGVITDSAFMALGEHNFVISANDDDYTTTFRFISVQDSSGYLIAYIPVLTEDNKSGYSSSDKGDKIAISLGAVAGYATYISEQHHFIIKFPTSVLTQTYDLADYLETAYDKFHSKSLGFSYSERTNWPMEVTVKRLKSTVFGYSCNSMWGNNYGWMEFNFDKMDDGESLRLTAGHEFFHFVQSLYDPRNRYSKAKFRSPNLWLFEASSVWSEAFFSDNSNYASPIFIDNVFDIFKGAKTGNASSRKEIAEYGYGMAAFIKYIAKKHGSDKIVFIYDKIFKGSSAFDAINSVLTVDAGYNWHSFLKSLFAFDLYKNKQFNQGSIISQSKQRHHQFIIDNKNDTDAEYNFSLTDMSADIFSIKNNYTGWDENTSLKLTCLDGKIQVYKITANSSEFLASSKDSITIDNLKDFIYPGSQIGVIVYNNNFNDPFESKQDYKLNINVVSMKRPQFSGVMFRMTDVGCVYHEVFNDGTTYESSDWKSWESPKVDPLTTVDPISKTITVTKTYYTDADNHNTHSITITLDDFNNPTKVVAFTYSVIIDLHDSDITTHEESKIVGQNIPLVMACGSYYTFSVQNDITPNILEIKSDISYDNVDGTSMYGTLISYDVDYSEIYIELYLNN